MLSTIDAGQETPQYVIAPFAGHAGTSIMFHSGQLVLAIGCLVIVKFAPEVPRVQGSHRTDP